jgi:hypothetical protein
MYFVKEDCISEFCSVEQILTHPYDEDSRWLLQKPSDCVEVSGNEWTYTGNLCASLGMFLNTNGFDPRLSSRGEDCDFGLRAGKLGANIVYNPKAKSVNLCTRNNPILANVCDHAFSNIEKFKNIINSIDVFYAHSKQIPNVKLGSKYGCDVLFCNICGAEYILNPSKFVYDKQDKKEYVVPKELFDLEKERKRICAS